MSNPSSTPYNTRSTGQSSTNPIPVPDPTVQEPLASPNSSDHSTPAISSDVLHYRMLELLERLSANSASPHPPAFRVSETKHLAKEPDSFNGDKNELENFITSCVLYMDCFPGTFSTDKTKINFIISHCRQKVLKSLRPLLNQAEQPELLQRYDKFLEYLRRHWGDPDEKGNAKREMRKLRQQGSASDFFLKFNQLVAILGWSPESEILVENAIDKLDEGLKDEIVRKGGLEVSSIDDLMDFVIPLDNRIREREKEKREARPSYQRSSFRTPIVQTTPIAPQALQTTASTQHFRPGPLPNEEKDRRRSNNLCMYCGNPDHITDACPKKGKAPARKV